MNNNQKPNDEKQRLYAEKMELAVIDELPGNISVSVKQQIEEQLFKVFKKYEDKKTCESIRGD